MKSSETHPKVEAYLDQATRWREELNALRAIMLGCQLKEELKWGKLCYTFEGHNVVLIMVLKESCSLLFFKGALLSDSHGLLFKGGENTEAGRRMRFASVREIRDKESILKAHLQEAIEVEKAGLQVVPKKAAELAIPEEFKKRLDGNAALKRAFNALTPGRQRSYIFYFSGAKQSKTREARVEKYVGQILKGKGMEDE